MGNASSANPYGAHCEKTRERLVLPALLATGDETVEDVIIHRLVVSAANGS